MPVQDVRLPEVTVKGEVRGESSGMPMTTPAPRPAAVDAIRWASTLLTQLGLENRKVGA